MRAKSARIKLRNNLPLASVTLSPSHHAYLRPHSLQRDHPQEHYLNRRNFIRAGAGVASLFATGIVYRTLTRAGEGKTETTKIAGVTSAPSTQGTIDMGFVVDEPKTPLENVTHYNNFYEFSTSKDRELPPPPPSFRR